MGLLNLDAIRDDQEMLLAAAGNADRKAGLFAEDLTPSQLEDCKAYARLARRYAETAAWVEDPLD